MARGKVVVGRNTCHRVEMAGGVDVEGWWWWLTWQHRCQCVNVVGRWWWCSSSGMPSSLETRGRGVPLGAMTDCHSKQEEAWVCNHLVARNKGRDWWKRWWWTGNPSLPKKRCWKVGGRCATIEMGGEVTGLVVGAQPACCLKPSNEGRSVGGEREVVGANGRSWMQTGACGRKQEVLESSKRARVVGKR